MRQRKRRRSKTSEKVDYSFEDHKPKLPLVSDSYLGAARIKYLKYQGHKIAQIQKFSDAYEGLYCALSGELKNNSWHLSLCFNLNSNTNESPKWDKHGIEIAFNITDREQAIRLISDWNHAAILGERAQQPVQALFEECYLVGDFCSTEYKRDPSL